MLLLTSAFVPFALLPTLICAPIFDICHSNFCLADIWLHQSNWSFLLLLYCGLLVARFDPWDTPSQWTLPKFLILGLHITPPYTSMYGCSLFPSSSKFPPPGGLFLSGIFHSISSVLLQLWLLHNLLRLLMRLCVERLALNQQVTNLFFDPQRFACILDLESI